VPIEPPAAPPRYDPVFVTDEDLDDLATFTGRSREACLERLRSFSPTEMAEAWHEADPRTPEEMLAFYEKTDLYVWELMQWHASPARQPFWNALTRLVEVAPPRVAPRVFDFGCGVGTDALFLKSRGYDVTLVDVDGPGFRFARHRFERRGWDAGFETSTSPLPTPKGVYDIAVSFDVFEHLPDPLKAVSVLVDHLREGGVLVQNGEFSDDGDHPCHLHSGVEHFGAGRWYAELAGMGMKGLGTMLYRKAEGRDRWVQRSRYALWRASGLWLEHPGR